MGSSTPPGLDHRASGSAALIFPRNVTGPWPPTPEAAAAAAPARARATVGVNVTFMRVLAWITGSFMTGLGGPPPPHHVGIISPTEFGLSTSVAILPAPVIGGARTFWGTMLGAAVISFLPWILTVTEVESRLM